MPDGRDQIAAAARAIRESTHMVVFTGAGISVESGVPPFRGAGGLWEKYDPQFIELEYFYHHPRESWEKIKEVFYDFLGSAAPNPAHRVLAEWERAGIVKAVITQNIDNLHHAAGSRTVYEYHGTTGRLLCLECGKKFPVEQISLNEIPPHCPACGFLLKPDFVFFSEMIPPEVARLSDEAAQKADVMLVIGTTGEVMPAAGLPYIAKRSGAAIIEVNPTPSTFTVELTDIFIQGKAVEIMEALKEAV